MTRAMISRVLVLALMASTVAWGAPGGPVLAPVNLNSVPRNVNAKIEAVATASSPASTIASCRAYFRASGSTGFYFVDMKRGDCRSLLGSPPAAYREDDGGRLQDRREGLGRS